MTRLDHGDQDAPSRRRSGRDRTGSDRPPAGRPTSREGVGHVDAVGAFEQRGLAGGTEERTTDRSRRSPASPDTVWFTRNVIGEHGVDHRQRRRPARRRASDSVRLPVCTPHQKAATAPMSIIPSTPRFITPDRSVMISPSAASRIGVPRRARWRSTAPGRSRSRHASDRRWHRREVAGRSRPAGSEAGRTPVGPPCSSRRTLPAVTLRKIRPCSSTTTCTCTPIDCIDPPAVAIAASSTATGTTPIGFSRATAAITMPV